MQGLGTRLECQHKVSIRTEKHCGKSIAAPPDSNLLLLCQKGTIIPLRYRHDL